MPIYEDAEEQAEDRTFYDNAEEQQEDWSFYDNIEEQPGEDRPGYDGESLRVNTDWLYDYEEKRNSVRNRPERNSIGLQVIKQKNKVVRSF